MPCWRSASGLNPPDDAVLVAHDDAVAALAEDRAQQVALLLRLLAGLDLGGEVLEDDGDVAHLARPSKSGKKGGRDGDAPSLRDLDLRELARVVPHGADGDGLPREGPMNEVEHAVALRESRP